MMFTVHATDIVGYTYQAATYCGDCIVDAINHDAKVGLDLTNASTEDALGLIAEHNAIDRTDESSFDSGDFPKVIFADQADNVHREDGEMTCDECNHGLVTGEPVFRGTAISNNHFSVDQQAVDAMSHLNHHHYKTFVNVCKGFLEYPWHKMSGSHFDTDAMGVDAEWGLWLIDAIEATEVITWNDGEPYCTARECRS